MYKYIYTLHMDGARKGLTWIDLNVTEIYDSQEAFLEGWLSATINPWGDP